MHRPTAHEPDGTDGHDAVDANSGLFPPRMAPDLHRQAHGRLSCERGEAGMSVPTYSIGATVRDDGVVRSVAWNGPASCAGLRPGIRISEVDGTAFTHEALLDAVPRSARGLAGKADQVTS
jgi:predicted metalloprotease with PDZ domain